MSSISIVQQFQPTLQQNQQLLINLAMKQAFHVLQLPQIELAEWLKDAIENNPVLEIDLTKESFKESLHPPQFRDKVREKVEQRRREHQESLLTASTSLYEHLTQQTPLAFESPDEIQLANLLIGHLNEKGYLDTPLNEIAPHVPIEKMKKILSVVQTLDPPGIAAASLVDCLLLQLRLKNKGNGLAAKILSYHFEDLLHNRLPAIAKQLYIDLPTLSSIIENEIAPLDLYPGYRFCPQPNAAILPDLFFYCCEGEWKVEVNSSYLPRFQIAPAYADALNSGSLEKGEAFYLRRQISGGRWLKRIVSRRNQTLRSIGKQVLKKQLPFFNQEQRGLAPMSIQEIAEKIGVHESTVARAVANKFVSCPQGLFSLKSLFSQGVSTAQGKKISTHSLREMLATLIEKEDKANPLSDEQIAHHFQQMGISCARRTIAKYRTLLSIAPAAQRKKWDAKIT